MTSNFSPLLQFLILLLYRQNFLNLMQDFTGFARTVDRKEEGRFDEVDVLSNTSNIPKYVGIPAKY